MKEWSTLYELVGAVWAIYLSLVFWWYRHNQRIFFPPANSTDDERDRYKNDLKRRYDWIANRRFASKYQDLLGKVLEWIATHLTKDAHLLKEYTPPPRSSTGRLFGLNSFTERSYQLCLRLAFVYPIASLFLFWLLGGTGEPSGLIVFPDNLGPGARLVVFQFDIT